MVPNDPFEIHEKMSFEIIDKKLMRLLTDPELKAKDTFTWQKCLDYGIKVLKSKILKEKPKSYFDATEEEEKSVHDYPFFFGYSTKTTPIVHEDFYKKLNPNYESFNVTD